MMIPLTNGSFGSSLGGGIKTISVCFPVACFPELSWESASHWSVIRDVERFFRTRKSKKAMKERGKRKKDKKAITTKVTGHLSKQKDGMTWEKRREENHAYHQQEGRFQE